MNITEKTQNTTASMTVAEAYQSLQDVLANLGSSESWLEYLSFQSKFYGYSFYNTLMILSQNPLASYVAGYKTWQSMNRFVRKGEKGIRILAPLVTKRKDPSPEESPTFIKGFRLVSVFDFSQTEGSEEDLPLLVTGLKHTVHGEEEIFEEIKSKITLPIIEVEKLSSKGSYNPTTKLIKIKSDLTTVQKIKTLIHEYAHHVHHTYYEGKESYNASEVIAESSAYIVCQILGIDTSDYSAPYIETWKDASSDLATIGIKVQKVSSEIISLLKGSNPSETALKEVVNA